MKTSFVVFGLVAVFLIAAMLGYYIVAHPATITTPTPTPSSVSLDGLIRVTEPIANAQISSPLKISGQARGNWYFEASFPVVLTDAAGNVLAQMPAQAKGDWMTAEFVPFEAELSFVSPGSGQHGTLTLRNDNPSGLPENDKSIAIPVVFK